MTGTQFKALRLKIGFSQITLGEKLDVDRRTIQRWENSKPTVCGALALGYLAQINAVSLAISEIISAELKT